MSLVLRLSGCLVVLVLFGGCSAAHGQGAPSAVSVAARNVAAGQADPRSVAQQFISTIERGDAAANCRLWHTDYSGCVRSEKKTFRRVQYRAGGHLRIRQTADEAKASFTVEARVKPATRFRLVRYKLILRRYGGRWQEIPPSD